jgi:hypothetical protein
VLGTYDVGCFLHGIYLVVNELEQYVFGDEHFHWLSELCVVGVRHL